MLLPSFLMSANSAATALVSLLLLDSVQAQAPTADNSTQSLTGFPPCDALISANLSHAVHLPSSPLYSSLLTSYFSLDTRRAAWCFVLPSTSAEVSQVITALRSAGDGAGDWYVAVRSGGHGSAESNNIAQGVTIDLALLNSTTYDVASNVASFGTGARWGSVYTELAKHDVLVPGGREGIVGVGGFVLGGGISWYATRAGFTCDSAVNFEVVLASGEIVNANASSRSDLWQALKGGASNFGIVTRFDLEAIPATNLTIESRAISIEHADELADAFTQFVDLDDSFRDNTMISLVTYDPKTGTNIAFTEVNTANDMNTTAFDKLNRIPTLIPSTKQSLTLLESVNSTELASGTRNSGLSFTTINDAQVMRYAFRQHDDLIASLKISIGAQNFKTLLDFQPLPGYIANIGAQRGGNMLGLTSDTRNKITFVLSVTLTGSNAEEQYPGIVQQVAAAVQRIKAFSKSIGKDEAFTYLNYAGPNQNPLGSYGAASVRHIRNVANKYDRDGFFQHRVPGGFKIHRAV